MAKHYNIPTMKKRRQMLRKNLPKAEIILSEQKKRKDFVLNIFRPPALKGEEERNKRQIIK